MEMREIKGWEGYFVTNTGDVYSTRRGSLKKRKTMISRNGYVQVGLSDGGKIHNLGVHRFVAEAFVENPEGKPQVNHIDGDKTNNNAANLEWCTASENQRHAVLMGLTKSGESHNRTEYTNAQVHSLCQHLQDGLYNDKTLSKMLGITESVISKVVRKEAWVHISRYYDLPKRPNLSSALSEQEVIQICTLLKDGVRVKDVAEVIGTTKHTVSRIKRGVSYTSISKKYLHGVSTTIESTSCDGSE